MSRHSKKSCVLILCLYCFPLSADPVFIKADLESEGKVLQLFHPLHETMQIFICTALTQYANGAIAADLHFINPKTCDTMGYECCCQKCLYLAS